MTMHKTAGFGSSGATPRAETECLIAVDRSDLKASRCAITRKKDADMKTYDNELADVFAMLHPATLPMLKHMFEDFKRDAEDDGQTELIDRADKAIAAVALVMAEQEE
jgi:hypothetical protein